MSVLSTRKIMLCAMSAAAILCGAGATLLAVASPASAASNYSYGGVQFYGPAYQYRGHNGQMGNVTFFGAPPTTYPSHNGQMGNVTYLGGVQPYSYRGHNGQVGNVTYFGTQPRGTVPLHTVPVHNLFRVH
ncbi:hypothetical protein [Methylovirgula sp. 4M-Z18]|uniref:hypothetical protein n=1 Tax=Methylovirgula sp. 4M-Z18 TaxID=2293567 RepID=UPI000E2E6912|nr:hypothetical protein [Methylovirgula sp. 4M-Z18]RFB79241.1 hypothetical protein DYH55_11725 [Methylovirgula sp. 4M-Z18]